MKRPKFFEDLDRSLSGESEAEPEPVHQRKEPPPCDDLSARLAMAALNQENAQAHQAAMFQQAMMNQIRASQGVENMTATGATIAAQQRDYSLVDLWRRSDSFWDRVAGGLFER